MTRILTYALFTVAAVTAGVCIFSFISWIVWVVA